MKYYIMMHGKCIDRAYNIKDAREWAETWSKVWRDWCEVRTKTTLKCAYDDGEYHCIHGKLTKSQLLEMADAV